MHKSTPPAAKESRGRSTALRSAIALTVLALVLFAVAAGVWYVGAWFRQTRQENLWQAAREQDSVAALAAFASENPDSPLCADAQRRITELRGDDSRFETPTAGWTVQAVEQFLADYPGHRREPEARALLERMGPRDVFERVAAGEVAATASGAGIEHVGLTLRRLVPHEVGVIVPVGTFFVAGNENAQSMVATHEERVQLASDEPATLEIRSACANIWRAIPCSADGFRLQVAPKQRELKELAPRIEQADVPTATAQAAVWIVTDDASWSDLGVLVVSQFGFGFGGSRAIDEESAVTAMKLCADAGVDIGHRKIAADRFLLVHGMGVAAHGVSAWCRTRLETLGYRGTDAEILLGILENEEDEPMATAAAAAVAKLEAAVVREPLRKLLTAAGAGTRRRAAKALGGLGSPSDLPFLAGLLKDQSEEVRCAAVKALGAIDCPARSAALAQALADEAESVAQAAVDAAARTHDATLVPALLEALRHQRQFDFRGNVARALGAIGGTAATAGLFALLEDESDWVRLEVAGELERIGDFQAIAPLEARRAHEEDETTRQALDSALATIRDRIAESGGK